jgi:hypothetical protein
VKTRNRRPPTLTEIVAVRLTKEECLALGDIAIRQDRNVSNIIRRQVQILLRDNANS